MEFSTIHFPFLCLILFTRIADNEFVFYAPLRKTSYVCTEMRDPKCKLTVNGTQTDSGCPSMSRDGCDLIKRKIMKMVVVK
jgi:hypothetical protein